MQRRADKGKESELFTLYCLSTDLRDNSEVVIPFTSIKEW